MSCCPKGSWGKLELDYAQKGQEVTLGDMQLYHVGSGEKCIIWCYDIFGFIPGTNGRTRKLADFFADKGYMVVMPDFYRGRHCDPFTAEQSALVEFIQSTLKTNFSDMDGDLEKAVEFAKSKGAKSFGTIGTCWGSIPVMRLSRQVASAGVSMHPSHAQAAPLGGYDVEAMLKLIMPCKNDPDTYRPGGLHESVLGDKYSVLEFKNQDHGFTTRGENENVDEDLTKALGAALDFFSKYV